MLFATVGKLIANLSWASDGAISKVAAVSSLCVLPLVFATAFRGSAYATAKHSAHLVLIDVNSILLDFAGLFSLFVL